MRSKINITVATSINGKGGVATVLNTLNSGVFFNNWNMKLIASHYSESKYKGLNRLFLFASVFVKLVYFNLFYNVGIVHIHMSSRGSYLRKSLIVRFIKLFNNKIIIHLHGAEFQEFYKNESSLKKQAHIRNTFDLADSVIVLSTQWLAWAHSIVKEPSKVKIVYNAVPQLTLDRSVKQNASILFLGRLGERKGVADLIHAFKKLLAKDDSATLLLGGDGDIEFYKKLVDSLGIKNQVQFLGWVSGDEKNAYLAKADVYCLPSYNEGFPMGVLEAMSAGVAVVASTAGGIPDAISSGKEGLLITAGDVDGLADALLRITSDRALNDAFTLSAKNKFDQNFSEPVVFKVLDKIYNQLLG
ncbi:glycosyltransferase family 4 protein [Psychromonas sp. Urea-02u-13]|uniref:glycosyltransferase family 4 protein n=1 Tax=Psychromonas sp. Urea-02u-13 TaxID=2058326 RepID=UPI000C33EE1D|nr:glycosyltransferase family 4 protein [Psychromonas sp. Urea-02u-13]PKG37531.1 glycosyltransferase family 1 protein [Psychromonas sp. Urea-02u-13]